MATNTIFEQAVNRLLDVTGKFGSALDAAGIPYRVIGGLAVFLHVDKRDPLAARMTKDVDVAVDRKNLDAIRQTVEPYGFTFRHVAGVDMFLDANEPRARNAVHVVFAGEKVRPDYVEAVPASDPVRVPQGFFIASVVDLVHMKLTSFRLKDKVHIQDMDAVGLITPEIEATLSPVLAERLAEVRATE